MEFKSSFKVNATLIPNEFIDNHMANVSGEYMKEYLYLLRHEGEEVTLSMIADALNHTEADVARAVSYWKKAGILSDAGQDISYSQRVSPDQRLQARPAGTAGVTGTANLASTANLTSTAGVTGAANVTGTANLTGAAGVTGAANLTDAANLTAAANLTGTAGVTAASNAARAMSSATISEAAGLSSAAPGTDPVKAQRPVYTPEQISGLAGDEDFSQLLYIVQKYLNKVFTQRECEVFAYLYDGLHMSAELLEYLVEYCVQGGHTSMRYIETVAINWHERGLKTVDEAKTYASSYSKDSFAVMKAFGINDRSPAAPERDMIERWFGTYGFTKELVLEACNRTIEAIHSPSFKYAEKILSEWKKAGVRRLEDVRHLDEQRAGRTQAKKAVSEQKNASGARGRSGQNQFQNFPQRDVDYDALVLQQLKEQ